MSKQYIRTALLLGEEGMEKLHNSHVAVFGVGGVGGYVVEALARSGVGAFDLIDDDTVSLSNINRQIIATHDTIGKYKVDVMKERILSINPHWIVNVHNCFFLPDNQALFDFKTYDYVVDAIDTVSAKIALVMCCNEAKTPIICSMGTGNKLNPQAFEVTDIYKTSIDPLARVMRQELKKRRVKKLKVVYSKEYPLKPLVLNEEEPQNDNSTRKGNPKKVVPGSTAFVPSSAGLLIASEVVKDIIKR